LTSQAKWVTAYFNPCIQESSTEKKKTAAATVRESETSTLCQSAFNTTALLPSVRALLSNKQVNVIFLALLWPKSEKFVMVLKIKMIKRRYEGPGYKPSTLPQNGLCSKQP